MSIFKPTYLYLKEHKITKLLYFGKTTRNPLHYNGSGKYWKKHLKKHGNQINTIWYKLFDDEKELIEYAVKYSNENNIVASSLYANCREENGIDGKPPGAAGHIFTEEQKIHMSKAQKNRWNDPIHKDIMIKKHLERWKDNETLKKYYSIKHAETWNEEMKAHQSQVMMGHIGSKKLLGISKSEEHKEKIRQSLRGKPKSEEHKKKISESRKRTILAHSTNIDLISS
jgi:hypothetical protein